MSEHRIKRFVFWVGGVILPTLSQVLLERLGSGRSADVNTRAGLLELERALAAGTVDAAGFCRQAAALAGDPQAAGRLLEEIPQHVEPLPGMALLVGEIACLYQIVLVSDYPRQWLLPALERAGLSRWFPDDALFITAEQSVPLEHGALFEALVASRVMLPGSSLWIDHNPARASTAVRAGLDVGIFVDARRLRRDLSLLWGLLPVEA